jgi:hypothetical protein
MTARFTPSEIAAAAREARANGVAVELHKPDGSKIVVTPQVPPQMDDFDRVDMRR